MFFSICNLNDPKEVISLYYNKKQVYLTTWSVLTANVYINYAFVLIAPQAKVHVLALMYTAKHAQDELLAIILAQVAQLKSVKKTQLQR